jgi:hypothetical protein
VLRSSFLKVVRALKQLFGLLFRFLKTLSKRKIQVLFSTKDDSNDKPRKSHSTTIGQDSSFS